MQKANKTKQRPLYQRIGIDILGILLIIAAGLFGWLPGPGGTPLLLAGLSLLAINHEWARRLLENIKDKGTKIMDMIFKDHPVLAFFYDCVAIALLLAAGYFYGQATGNIVRGIATALAFLGIGLFLGNRKRIYAINKFVSKIIARKP